MRVVVRGCIVLVVANTERGIVALLSQILEKT